MVRPMTATPMKNPITSSTPSTGRKPSLITRRLALITSASDLTVAVASRDCTWSLTNPGATPGS